MVPLDSFPVTGYWLFDKLNWEQIEHRLRQSKVNEKKREHGEDRQLRCARCQRSITREDQRIPVQGRREHVCENPHGLVFHIGCFATAPGCTQIGIATEEWTWFRGYYWQIALCKSCGVHLGWRYRDHGGEHCFYGLILDRLTSGQED